MGKEIAVIIIGAGPAAYAAAVTCRNNGFKTIVVAGKSIDYSANKYIALESVHPGIESLFELLDLTGVLKTSTEADFEGIYVNDIFQPFGEDVNGAWQGHHIDKYKLLYQLKEEVSRLGVDFLYEKATRLLIESGRVTGVETSNGQIICSDYILDCSGMNQFAGRELKLKKNYYSPPLIVWTGVTSNIDKYLHAVLQTRFEMEQQRWIWTAPQQDYSCTWTQLSLKATADLLPPNPLSGFENNGVRVSNMRWQLYRPIVADGLMLCGDAAGILDPASGKGIFSGMYSGIIAANNIKRCLMKPEEEALYLAEYDNWFVTMYINSAKSLKSFYSENGLRWD